MILLHILHFKAKHLLVFLILHILLAVNQLGKITSSSSKATISTRIWLDYSLTLFSSYMLQNLETINWRCHCRCDLYILYSFHLSLKSLDSSSSWTKDFLHQSLTRTFLHSGQTTHATVPSTQNPATFT